jgi:monofunctional biosynthetic peptidoglycan transglycosylase
MKKRKSRKPRRLRAIFLATGKLFLFLFVFIVCFILLLRYIDPPTWSWRLHRAFNPPANYPQQALHQWCDLEEIPAALQMAVVASEDQNFPHHAGIDFNAIQQALDEAERGGNLRGASTITQQMVKNLFLWPGKDWTRKVLEAGLALLVERLWDKSRILEVYLNIVEFGPGVYGVCAGSEHWYRISVAQITRNEAARLAAVLPNPWRYQAEPPTPYVSERAHWIEWQMSKMGETWVRPEE